MAETSSKGSPKKAASAAAKSTARKSAAKPQAASALPAEKKAPAKAAGAPAKKSAPVKKAPAEDPPAPASVAGGRATAGPISDEQRYRMVAEAAYFRAESHQFKSDPVRDWIEAEADVAALLASGQQVLLGR